MLRKACLWLICGFLIVPQAFALNVQTQRPYLPYHRAASLIESKPKPKDTLTLGLGVDYALHPFEFGSSLGNIPRGSIVDHLWTLDFGVAYSPFSKLALGVNLPVHIGNSIFSFTNINQHTVANFGDVTVSGLFNVFSPEELESGIGFAVMPYVSLPTGDGADFVGDTNLTGGFMFVADVLLFGNHYIGLNAGMRFRETENILNLQVGQEILYGAGYETTLWPSQNLGGFVQVAGSASLSELQEISSPFEILFGLNKTLLTDNVLKLALTSGFGVGSGYGTPDYRAMLSVNYDRVFERREKPPEPVRIQKIEKRLKELTIYYPTDGAQVDPFYDEKIAEIAQILKDNPDLGPLYILGHTDDIAGDAYNQRLSERRAKQAFASILKYGVDTNKIVYRAFGEKYPVVPNDLDEQRALNRRTLFTFTLPAYFDGGVYELPVGTGSDSYTEILKQRERYEQGVKATSQGSTHTSPDGTIIQEEIRIEKVYDPTQEIKKQGKVEYRIKKKGEDSYTETLKSRSEPQPVMEPQSTPKVEEPAPLRSEPKPAPAPRRSKKSAAKKEKSDTVKPKTDQGDFEETFVGE